MVNESELPEALQGWLAVERVRNDFDPIERLQRYNWMVEIHVGDEGPRSADITEWQNWCYDNVRGFWDNCGSLFHICFMFSERSDAMLFLLRFNSCTLTDLRLYLNPPL